MRRVQAGDDTVTDSDIIKLQRTIRAFGSVNFNRTTVQLNHWVRLPETNTRLKAAFALLQRISPETKSRVAVLMLGHKIQKVDANDIDDGPWCGKNIVSMRNNLRAGADAFRTKITSTGMEDPNRRENYAKHIFDNMANILDGLLGRIPVVARCGPDELDISAAKRVLHKAMERVRVGRLYWTKGDGFKGPRSERVRNANITIRNKQEDYILEIKRRLAAYERGIFPPGTPGRDAARALLLNNLALIENPSSLSRNL